MRTFIYQIQNTLKKVKGAAVRLGSSRLTVLLIVFCLTMSILICRLFYLQIIKGQEYAEEYELQIRKTEKTEAARGNIYDRNGNLLAYNRLVNTVTIQDMTDSDQTVSERNEELNGILEQVLEIVEKNGDSVIDSFGISLDSEGNYQFNQTSETQRLRFVADVYGCVSADDLTAEQKGQTAEELIHYLCTDETYGYGLDEENMEPEYILKMINMRYALHLNSYQQYVSTEIAVDVSEETVAAIMENSDALAGVDIKEDTARTYTDAEYFSSILGYTGQISLEEYDALDEEEQEEYSLTDIVGKTGLEEAYEDVLRGKKGENTFYVDNMGNVTETVSTTEPEAGNDVYLTIDSDIQEYTYQLIEEKLAGIILSKLDDVLDYDASTAEDSSEIRIPVGDAYYSFIGNYIIDYTEFGDDNAGEAEQEVFAVFESGKETAVSGIMAELEDEGASPYSDLSEEMQSYMDYISENILSGDAGILDSDAVDTQDETYLAWNQEGSISLFEYLDYAISQNWVDTSGLEGENYSTSGEIYDGILNYIEEQISGSSGFDKLVYKNLIRTGAVTGAQICSIVYEQGVLEMDEDLYNGLRSGTVSAYSWLCDRIENLDITPGQLALEPCSAGAVVTDPDTGEVLACVSYPGYDSSRLADEMDTEYYNQLVNGMNNIFYNRATQEKTAPGSTYKMVSAVAGLTEGVIDAGSWISCSGSFTKVTPSPNCWIYPGAHGSLNVVGALEVSCNSFFYEVGYRLGQDAEGTYDSEQGIAVLAEYAELFGLGEKSGVEIPEAEPEISDEYAVQSAIGQGTNNYTVSQLARYVSAVANRGNVNSLTLVDRITYADGTVISENETETARTMEEVSEDTWDLVQEGMEQMVSSSSTFAGIDFSMAGKTGTAQQSSLHPDHALFVGYAPSDSPEIAVAVRIAYGYSSSYAAEIGRDVAKIWFDRDAAGEVITGKAAELGTAISGD